MTPRKQPSTPSKRSAEDQNLLLAFAAICITLLDYVPPGSKQRAVDDAMSVAIGIVA